jgi:hypothetical protein
MVGYEALGAGLSVQENGTVRLPLITSSYVNTNPPHPHSLWCEHVLYTELYTTQPAIPPVLYPQHPVTIVP